MEIRTGQEMYVAELQELVDAERQLVDFLQHAAHDASHNRLEENLMLCREETLAQRERLGTLLTKHAANPREHRDSSVATMVKEAEKMVEIAANERVRDAALIASTQKLLHYQIAAYGTCATLAKHLGLHDDQRMLHDNLEEERAADQRLTKLAKTEINPDALAA